MKYIFHDGRTKGEYPVETFHIAWYDMTTKNKRCFDESFYTKDQFDPNELLSYLETKENKRDNDRCRIFVNMKNGDIYEMKLKKIDKKKIQDYSYFWGCNEN